jgi:Zn-dependent M28 family amino/carboxypeptidase
MSMPGVNVLGYIEGIDQALKEEVVVITAHYDHLGHRGNDIFYGADDNASGTSAVLEIAQAFAEAKAIGQGPRRSDLCMLVTGEEKGLLGSQYYAEHPVFPLDHTVANVNIDMIGRTDQKHDHTNYTYVIGSDRLSTELHEINETANRLYTHLKLDYTYNDDDDPNRFYYRSDHYNFAKNGVPAIFYFSGVHDDYHRPTDTPDKVMYEKAETIARLAFHTAWELANRDQRIKVDVFGRN